MLFPTLLMIYLPLTVWEAHKPVLMEFFISQAINFKKERWPQHLRLEAAFNPSHSAFHDDRPPTKQNLERVRLKLDLDLELDLFLTLGPKCPAPVQA